MVLPGVVLTVIMLAVVYLWVLMSSGGCSFKKFHSETSGFENGTIKQSAKSGNATTGVAPAHLLPCAPWAAHDETSLPPSAPTPLNLTKLFIEGEFAL